MAAAIKMASNRNGRTALPGILLVAGVIVVAMLVGIILGSVIAR